MVPVLLRALQGLQRLQPHFLIAGTLLHQLRLADNSSRRVLRLLLLVLNAYGYAIVCCSKFLLTRVHVHMLPYKIALAGRPLRHLVQPILDGGHCPHRL